MAEFDFDFLSLTMAMVGLFFICCAILQRKPKHILEDAFGVSNQALRDLKSAVFKKNQLVLGYSGIMLAIILNIFSHSMARDDGTRVLDRLDAMTLAAALVGLVAVLCGILNWLSRLFSKWHFKKIVKVVVTERHLPFESNVSLAVEIGQLLGVSLEPGDSVEAYVTKLREFLELPAEPETKRRVTRNSRVGIDFR
ncbi:MAG: hypothetical protein CMJ83_04710 [Planctomycetes bacterium]|nr:hypothetical protein [Planctomycetota bacterium]